MKNYRSLEDIRKDLSAGEITVAALTDFYIGKIEEHRHLNIFLEVFISSARKKAKEVDEKIIEGRAGKLAGMVIALKDNICYKGHKVSASSRILENFESLYSATVVERLLAEDAVIIGRTNCDEFAMGSSNENSAFGNVLNPFNEKFVPGGSSGGSAAAVAAGLCLAALGTDTGGSIRQPASFCGVVGVKPTYGRVSRYGAIAYASSFDQIGPLSNNIHDSAVLLEVMAGADDYDSTASAKAVPSYSTALTPSNGKLKIAYLSDCIESAGLDPAIRKQILSLIDRLRADGHTVEAVPFPYLDYLVPTYYVLTTAEASSNLARYDGITYGYRSAAATDLESTYKKSRSEGFGEEVKRRIMLGTFVLSAGYYDAYYSKAQKVRRLLRDRVNHILSEYDFILSPSTPGTAFQFGQKGTDPIAMYLEDIFTVLANITGHPAISIPAGRANDGMPFGVQLTARPFAESSMFSFAAELLKTDKPEH